MGKRTVKQGEIMSYEYIRSNISNEKFEACVELRPSVIACVKQLMADNSIDRGLRRKTIVCLVPESNRCYVREIILSGLVVSLAVFDKSQGLVSYMRVHIGQDDQTGENAQPVNEEGGSNG
jgi:hypothetical protein